MGLAASSFGIVASDASAYSAVMEFLLPLIVPLMLFRADLVRVIKSTGTLLLAFLLGSGRVALQLVMLQILFSYLPFCTLSYISLFAGARTIAYLAFLNHGL